MWAGLRIVTENLGFSLETLILLILMLGGLVFYAKDFKLGLIIQMLASACCMIAFYQGNMNWIPSLTTFILTFVILSLSLYAQQKAAQSGGGFT